ncbi:hypothetical protein [Flammeovirga sp. OC4]|nr:hypothetical protein [Flammeovirga sp. OC4]
MKFQELELDEVREVNGGMVLGSSAAWGRFWTAMGFGTAAGAAFYIKRYA